MKLISVFLVVALLPAASAQMELTDDWQEIYTDAAGDQKSPSDTPVVPTLTTSIDLLALDLRETKESIDFRFTTTAVESQADLIGIADSCMSAHFTIRTQGWNVSACIAGSGPSLRTFCRLTSDEQPDYWMYLPGGSTDTQTKQSICQVGRKMLTDADGAPIGFGTVLQNITSYSKFEPLQLSKFPIYPIADLIQTEDRMPEKGSTLVSAQLALGGTQVGPVTLSSIRPFRSSNGDATTYIMNAALVSPPDTGVQEVVLSLEGVPTGWKVILPKDKIALNPGQDTNIPVLVTIPFAHAHGTLTSFILHAKTTGTNWISSIEMGVRFVDPPQPTGHHDTLYLHNGGSSNSKIQIGTVQYDIGGFGFISTDQADERAVEGNIPSQGGISLGNTPGGFSYASFEWFLPMAEGLLVGLDFDTSQTIPMSLGFNFPVPALDVSVRTSLEHYWFNPQTGKSGAETLASSEYTTPKQGSGQTYFDLEMTVNPEADYVPYADYANLAFIVTMEAHGLPNGGIVEGTEPLLLAGQALQLPLNEYHDNADELFAGISSAVVELSRSTTIKINPGETAIIEVKIRNRAGDEGKFTLNATGTSSKWSTLVGAPTLKLASGEQTTRTLAIKVPADALHGDVGELVLQVQSQSDPLDVNLKQIRIQVVTDEDIPDEAAEFATRQSSTKDTPFPSFALGLLALAFVGLLRRK